MTVVLWDISVNKRMKNNSLVSTPDIEARMLTLDEYHEIARRCIGAFASGDVRNTMLRSEDALSFVAEHLMYATCRWTPDGGRTLRSYLNQCAIWAIQRWIVLVKVAGKHKHVSLNLTCQALSQGRDSELYSILSNDDIEPIDELCQREQDEYQKKQEDAIRGVMDSELTDTQRKCIELIYIQGLSGADTARILGISRQGVEQSTTKGLTKIRTTLNGEISDRLEARQ